MSDLAVKDYVDVRDRIGKGRSHILLGNGFSIACNPIFRYERLYDNAVSAGLSERAQRVFGRLGTNNFEGVMRLLEDAHWVAEEYGASKPGLDEMLQDVEIVKRTLVEAVASSHLENTGAVENEMKETALPFLDPYYNIFTTNYDLLVYWVNMHRKPNPLWQDGFRSDTDLPDAPYVVFSERLGRARGIFFLHGALHLYLNRGELRKQTWIRTGRPLTHLIRDSLARGEYPLFVAEGSPERKLEQIQRSGYLWYCLDKLARIQGPLVVFGHSLGESDGHIAEVIADNCDLNDIYVGLFGDPDSESNVAVRSSVAAIQSRRRKRAGSSSTKQLNVHFYDSGSAPVWHPADVL
jgi:hypothetical protein